MQKRNILAVLATLLMLSLLLSLGVSAEEFPNGSTVYYYDAQGTDKEIITKFVDNDSGTLLKTLDMFGPAGEYFTDGVRMWGYDAVSSDFPWHMMVSAEMTSMSGSTSYDGGRSYYTQIGAKFTKLLSPDTYNATVNFDPHTCVANVKHITVDQDGNESLYSSSTLNLTYDSSFSTSKRYISNHTLNPEYSATVSGTFAWSLLDSIPNLPEDSYTSTYHSPTWEDIEESYHDEREIDIVFKYTLNHYSIEYDANGGENAPDPQTKWYGIDLTLSDDIPTRDGYTFLGWNTSPSSTYALYESGETYTYNSAKYFYAVWEQDEVEVVPDEPDEPVAETYTVTYDANGGSGAPASQTKTEGVDLTLSYREPTYSGYTFLGWTKYSWSSTVYYAPGDTYSNDADITLYAVWEEDEPIIDTPVDLPTETQSYTVSYDANGGSGAPSDQTKYEDVDLTLSSIKPTRSMHTFLGWATSASATSADYASGDTYSDNADITLYAVWQEDNYEFSISGLTMDTEIEMNGTLSISVRTDSWDQNNSYSDIPVQLLYDGSVVETQYIYYYVYGYEYVYFDINVGEEIGTHTVAVRINWSNRYDETDSTNNSVSGTVEVVSKAHELSVEGITPNASYRENTTVISSFNVYNDSDTEALPDEDYSVSFAAYYYSANSKVTLSAQTWDALVIPANGSNLVYFKWDVPDGLDGTTVYCEAVVNGNEHEKETTDNTDFFSVAVIGTPDSQPDDTYYGNTPSGFAVVDAPTEVSETASWEQWVYEDGGLVRKEYRAQLSYDLTFEPHSSVTTAVFANGIWTIKSGYGVTLTLTPDIISTAPTSAYTDIQIVYATFPEFKYSTADGYYAALKESGGQFSFVESPYSNTNSPVHFIPVWFPDGEYTVSVTVSDCWTPVGMIRTVVNTNNMTVSGTMYDDFYVGG